MEEEEEGMIFLAFRHSFDIATWAFYHVQMLMMQQFSKHVVRGKGEVSMTVSVSSANRINVLKVNIVRCSRTDRIAEAAGRRHDRTFKDAL